MKLAVEFAALATLVRRMGARPVEWRPGGEVLPELDLRERLQLGIEIEWREVDVEADGLFTYKGEHVLLYIKDSRKDRDTLLGRPQDAPRFHLVDCTTLEEMRRKKRFDRYVITTNTSGVFDVDAKDFRTQERETVQVRLLVCQNCLKKLNYNGFKSAAGPAKERAWHGFSIEDFFKRYESRFRERPRYTDKTAPTQGYAENWADISTRFRATRNWTCEKCGVRLEEHKSLLHTHHRNGQTADNRRENLAALCVECHAKEPDHRMRVDPMDREQLAALRRQQDLS